MFKELLTEKKKRIPTDKELEKMLKNADSYSGYGTFISLLKKNNEEFELSGKKLGDKIKAYWEKNINKGHFKPGDKGYIWIK